MTAMTGTHHRLIECILLFDYSSLDEENMETRGKTRRWLNRQERLGYLQTKFKNWRWRIHGFKEMLRMSYEDKQLLNSIEQHSTPHQVNVGNNVITAPERLALTLRFVATGESFKSLSFQFCISNGTISYIVKKVCDAFIKIPSPVYLKHLLQQMNGIKLLVNLINNVILERRSAL